MKQEELKKEIEGIEEQIKGSNDLNQIDKLLRKLQVTWVEAGQLAERERCLKMIEEKMDVYEIYELSEESGLQDELKKDILKIFKAGQLAEQKAHAEASSCERERCLKMIEEYYKNRIKCLMELGLITASEELEQDCKELTKKVSEEGKND